jgi:hypothetical protein
MKEKDILYFLAFSRGNFMKEKKEIIIKYFPSASVAFIKMLSLYFHILILVYIHPNCSVFRIYEHAKINTKISLNILLKFGFLQIRTKKTKHVYNITPLTRVIIADLIAAYKQNLATFDHLNLIDKKANYLEIKAKIKTLKQK